MLTKANLPKIQGSHNTACLWVATLLVLFPAGSPVPKQGLMLCKFLSNEQVTKKEPTLFGGFSYIQQNPILQNPPKM